LNVAMLLAFIHLNTGVNEEPGWVGTRSSCTH
jgi:hypothetical protein